MLLLSIVILLNQYVEPALNRHLKKLVESIRYHRDLANADSCWDSYIRSLIEEREFSEHTNHLGGLDNIKKHEVKFVDGFLSEAEFCHQIALDFSKDVMPIESEWFLSKSESLGLIDIETYFAKARNSAREWNDVLHYDEDLSDPRLKTYETEWRENLNKIINNSRDSVEIEEARLTLTMILDPSRNSYFLGHFAPEIIRNLEIFINTYPTSQLINQAYERLVWCLYDTERYEKLGEICKEFLTKYPDSPIKEYIKVQLGNAYYSLGDVDEAKAIYNSIEKDSFPESVYPGWGGRYILETIEKRLDSIGRK